MTYRAIEQREKSSRKRVLKPSSLMNVMLLGSLVKLDVEVMNIVVYKDVLISLTQHLVKPLVVVLVVIPLVVKKSLIFCVKDQDLISFPTL